MTGEYDDELFTALAEWRAGVAVETDKPAFTVFTDVTLEAVAEAQPSSVPELVQLKGIGPAKVDRYGAILLKIVADHRVRKNSFN